MSSQSLRPAFLHPLFFASGAAALGYQMIWARQFAAGLGHEIPSLIAVATAVLGGMALGAWLLDHPKISSIQPGLWYASLELTLGVWGALATLWIPQWNQLALRMIGKEASSLRQWAVVFLVPFLALLPSTVAMGATVSAMDRWLAPLFLKQRCVGAFYAANTLGSVAGTLGSIYFLVPKYGFRSSGLILASLNIACGFVAGVLSKSTEISPRLSTLDPGPPIAASPTRLYLTMFATGLLGVGFELVCVRVLSQVLEDTIYTYAVILATYLAGTAVGAAAWQKFAGTCEFGSLLRGLLLGLSCACLLSVEFLGYAVVVHDKWRDALGESPIRMFLADAVLAGFVFGLPTLLMGAIYSHLLFGARRAIGRVGRAVAINTAGCALAGGIFIVGLLPRFGAKQTLVGLALSYWTLLPQFRTREWSGWCGLTVLGLMLWALPKDLHLLRLPVGGKVLEYRDGILASVAVIQTPDGNRSLRVNNRFQMGGTASAMAERRQAHIPLLLHPNPRRALFLGPGTGITLGAASGHANLVSDGVELVPEILDVMPFFQPENNGPFLRTHLVVADARRFVRVTTNQYDVIVGDLFHPALDGAGFLYTREHFEAIRTRLQQDGLFCQWLPIHQLDDSTLRVIVRTFLEVFPDTHGILLHFNVDIPVLGLIGTVQPLRPSLEFLEQRMRDGDLALRLKAVGLDRPISLLGSLAASPNDLRNYAKDAPLNTDDHPLVTFLAPRVNNLNGKSVGERLLKFLDHCSLRANELVLPSANSDVLVQNLGDFLVARDLYLRGLVEEGRGRLPAAIDLYLESARRSLHFTSAYARCVTIIQVMNNTDRRGALSLFQRLEEAQPAQPLGRKLLGPLFQERK